MEEKENEHYLKETLSGIVWLFLTLVGLFIVVFSLLSIIMMPYNILLSLFFLSIGVTEITVGCLLKKTTTKPSKKGYEKLVDIYTRIYGADGKNKLDTKIEEYINQGLTREEAIQKVDMLLKKYRCN